VSHEHQHLESESDRVSKVKANIEQRLEDRGSDESTLVFRQRACHFREADYID